MATNGDNRPSVFAKYIDSPEKERPEPERNLTEPADLVSQWVQETNAKTFLKKILANGPVPTTVIEERAAAHGINMKQLRRAKRRTGIISFKEEGKLNGRWFWSPTQHTPEQISAVKHNDRYTRRLRDLSRIQGYRLQPTGKRG